MISDFDASQDRITLDFNGMQKTTSDLTIVRYDTDNDGIRDFAIVRVPVGSQREGFLRLSGAI